MVYTAYGSVKFFMLHDREPRHEHIIKLNPSKVIPPAHFCLNDMIRLHQFYCTSYPYEPLVSATFNISVRINKHLQKDKMS